MHGGASVMKVMIRTSAPQSWQRNGKTSLMLGSSNAHALAAVAEL